MKMNTESLLKFAAATNNELYDPAWQGGSWMTHATETHETLDDFETGSSEWVERSRARRGSIAGLPFVAWSSCQAVKGEQRRSMSVIDFGDIRVALDGDLYFYS